MPNQMEILTDLSRKRPLLRAKEARESGISTATLSRAVKQGHLERIERGLYRRPGSELDEHQSLSEVAARIPQGVIVLISALNFHQIGTHQAHAVWVQLKINAVTPKIDYPPISIVRTSLPRAFKAGVETHELNGVPVRITTPARTVADCFKHRRKLGLELCIEALREVVHDHAKPAEILKHAAMNRMEKIMVPYIEALA